MALAVILDEGLTPREDSRESNWDVPSRGDLVYLTDAYAGWFAAIASEDHRWGVCEVEVDDALLLPDEDFLEQADRHSKAPVCALRGMEARTAWFRDKLEMFRHHTDDSLAGLGNCAHEGEIPPAQITRAVVFNAKKSPLISHLCLDPQISLLNYKFIGPKYRALTKALMGEPTAPRDLSVPPEVWDMPGVIPQEYKDRLAAELASLESNLSFVK